jgi:hypothetical protein
MASRKNAAKVSPIDLPRSVVEALEYFGPEMTRLDLELIRRIEMIREAQAVAKRRRPRSAVSRVRVRLGRRRGRPKNN